ncbi:MAG: TolC family protein [Lentimicrobiaceae bacterium]|nr:TolC family protein [Lentimicrobiaceae bacterium]
MIKKPIIIFLLVLITSWAANAQKLWSLEDCIQYAMEKNLQIKQQQLAIDNADADLLQSKMGLLPDLNGGATHSYNYGQTIDRYTNQFATERVQSNNFYLQSSITLFNGFEKINTIRQNMVKLDYNRLDKEKYANDIALSIATMYLQVLYYTEMLDVNKNQLEITQMQVARMQKMVEAGTLANGDLLTIEAQAATEELSVVETQNQLDLAYLSLAQMMDLPSVNGFSIEKPEISLGEQSYLLENPDKIYDFALNNQPEIKSAKLKVKSSELGLARVRGYQYPTLSLGGSWATGYSGASKDASQLGTGKYEISVLKTKSGEEILQPVYDYEYKTRSFSNQIKDNDNKSIGLSLNIPIFNTWQVRTNINKSKIGIKSAELDLQLAENNLRKTIQQAYADAKASLNRYQASGKKVAASEEAFKYSEQKFTVGLLNTVDYNNTKKELNKSHSELLQSKYDYVFKTKVLDFYLGKPMTLKK